MKKRRWYVDADTLGLAKILVQVRPDVTYPGDAGQRNHPRLVSDPCVIRDPATDDAVWIPLVAKAGLAIITRDRRIQDRLGEKDAVIELAAGEPGPYIYSVTRTRLSRIAL